MKKKKQQLTSSSFLSLLQEKGKFTIPLDLYLLEEARFFTMLARMMFQRKTRGLEKERFSMMFQRKTSGLDQQKDFRRCGVPMVSSIQEVDAMTKHFSCPCKLMRTSLPLCKTRTIVENASALNFTRLQKN